LNEREQKYKEEATSSSQNRRIDLRECERKPIEEFRGRAQTTTRNFNLSDEDNQYSSEEEGSQDLREAQRKNGKENKYKKKRNMSKRSEERNSMRRILENFIAFTEREDYMSEEDDGYGDHEIPNRS
jgi:hypothetical protein